MSIEERLKATARNLEGKAQEVVGEVTGDPEAKAEGRAKQTEAAIRHQKENVKDSFKNVIDRA